MQDIWFLVGIASAVLTALLAVRLVRLKFLKNQDTQGSATDVTDDYVSAPAHAVASLTVHDNRMATASRGLDACERELVEIRREIRRTPECAFYLAEEARYEGIARGHRKTLGIARQPSEETAA